MLTNLLRKETAFMNEISFVAKQFSFQICQNSIKSLIHTIDAD